MTQTDVLVGKTGNRQTEKQNISIINYNDFCGEKKQGVRPRLWGRVALLRLGVHPKNQKKLVERRARREVFQAFQAEE